MATEFAESTSSQIRDVINQLQSPVEDISSLLSLLAAPLDALRLLPPQFRRYNANPLLDGVLDVSRHIPTLQRALLEYILPTWEATLTTDGKAMIFEQYFCPDAFSFASPAAGEVTRLAYATILSLPLTEHSIRLLARLTKEYPIDRLHSAVFSGGSKSLSVKMSVAWEDCVRNVVSVPAKVANAMGGKSDIPSLLEHGVYFNNVSLRCECLILSLSASNTKETAFITFLINKLVYLGLFPPSPPTNPSQPSFFQATLPVIRHRLQDALHPSYSALWSDIIGSLPSSFTLQAVLASLFASLSGLSSETDLSSGQRTLIKREAQMLHRLVGHLDVQNHELWESASAVMLNRDWTQDHSRVFVCWAAGAGNTASDKQALEVLLTKVLDMWSSPEHVKHSLLSRHRYLTSLLLVTLSYFPPSSPQFLSLALSPSFVSGIGIYISHLDNSVRRCGMLVAEVVAQRAGKKLDFGDWDGDGDGKPWARVMRQLIRELDIDADVDTGDLVEYAPKDLTAEELPIAVVNEQPGGKTTISNPSVAYDSDDSLTGYTSPSSSRSPSPTPSELDEIEKDPTLGVGYKKIVRPVYLAQLGQMLRSAGGLKASDDNQEADKIEMALNCAEELIRKKKSYGTELEENAVNLVYSLVGMQDNYDLENFDAKRQAAINALVACCPQKAAPSLIEEFFKNQYSTSQRYVMLNALAFGARELASLPVPPSVLKPLPNDHTSFPSKMLPGGFHNKYIKAGNQSPVQQILDDISRSAIERGKDDSSDKIPELVRERRLRIRKSPKVIDTDELSIAHRLRPLQVTSSSIAFTEIAAEFFIAPLINRFWLFLRDEQTREARTAHHESLYRYRGAGTGLILNPVILTHFLSTVAVLVHAAQNAPEWLAVVAPDALELAVTLGNRPVSRAEGEEKEVGIDGGQWDDTKGKEASLLTTTLELALVVLDGCLEVDGGRSLGLDHTALLLGAGEWAGQIFSQLEKGARIEGGGGAQEVKLRRAAAGLLLKVDDLTSKWRRSMIDIR